MVNAVIDKPREVIRKGDLVSFTLRDDCRIDWNSDDVSSIVGGNDCPSSEVRLIVDVYRDKGINSYVIGHQIRGRYGCRIVKIHTNLDCLKYEVLRYLGEKRLFH